METDRRPKTGGLPDSVAAPAGGASDASGAKPRLSRIVVVEGRDDQSAVLAAVDCELIVTHGFGIRAETWKRIERAAKGPGIIIFTDPDHAGEEIRRRITERFPEAGQVFLSRAEATKNGDIGIENASPDSIRAALAKMRYKANCGPRETAADTAPTVPVSTDNASEAAGTGTPASAPAEPFTSADLDT